MYGLVFGIVDGGHTRFVKHLMRLLLNKFRVENLKLFGLLCFLLAMYGQQVDRPMIHSTIALAYGWQLEVSNLASIDKYEGDYLAVKLQLFTIFSTFIHV